MYTLPAPYREQAPLPPRRRYGLRRFIAALLAIVVVLVALIAVSVVGAWRTPGNQSFQAKWADWLRSHHAAVLANAVEQYYYNHHVPAKGGRPARLNAVPAPSGPAAAAVRAGLAPPRPGLAGRQPGLARRGPVDPGRCRRWRGAGHVRGPVPRRYRLHQSDHLGGVDRPHPAAGGSGARRPGAGRYLAAAARHLGARPSHGRGCLQRRVPYTRRPRRLLPRRPPSGPAAARGGVNGDLRQTGGSISVSGAAMSP